MFLDARDLERQLNKDSLSDLNMSKLLFETRPQSHPRADYRFLFHSTLVIEILLVRDRLSDLQRHLARLEMIKDFSTRSL